MMNSPMTTMAMWMWMAIGLLAACAPDPAECTEKGNDAVCYKLCETGKPEFQSLCYMPRTRKILACVDKGTDCEVSCKEWVFEKDDTIRTYYMGNVGDTAKVEAIDKKCGEFKTKP